jgi:hypothetical protein
MEFWFLDHPEEPFPVFCSVAVIDEKKAPKLMGAFGLDDIDFGLPMGSGYPMGFFRFQEQDTTPSPVFVGFSISL